MDVRYVGILGLCFAACGTLEPEAASSGPTAPDTAPDTSAASVLSVPAGPVAPYEVVRGPDESQDGWDLRSRPPGSLDAAVRRYNLVAVVRALSIRREIYPEPFSTNNPAIGNRVFDQPYWRVEFSPVLQHRGDAHEGDTYVTGDRCYFARGEHEPPTSPLSECPAAMSHGVIRIENSRGEFLVVGTRQPADVPRIWGLDYDFLVGEVFPIDEAGEILWDAPSSPY